MGEYCSFILFSGKQAHFLPWTKRAVALMVGVEGWTSSAIVK